MNKHDQLVIEIAVVRVAVFSYRKVVLEMLFFFCTSCEQRQIAFVQDYLFQGNPSVEQTALEGRVSAFRAQGRHAYSPV